MTLVRGKDGVAEICNQCGKVRPNPPKAKWATVEVQVGKTPMVVREFHLCPECWREIEQKFPRHWFHRQEELELYLMLDKTGV